MDTWELDGRKYLLNHGTGKFYRLQSVQLALLEEYTEILD